jgi:hypothetical protein
MTTDVMRLPWGKDVSATEQREPHRLQTRSAVRLIGDSVPDLTRGRFWDEGRRARPYAPVFLLSMVVISLVRGVGDGLIGNVFFEWFNVAPDPFILSIVLNLGGTLAGLGVAGCFSRVPLDLIGRKHMLLVLLAGMGINLILVWLGRSIGYADVCNWPLVVVYILWAWAEVTSNA